MAVTRSLPGDESTEDETKVLVVDDDPELVHVVRTYLELKTDVNTIVTTTEPKTARKHVESQSFDCVISDYEMPEVNGLELLDVVRDTEPETEFLMFTNVTDGVVERGTHERGATYLRKEGAAYDDLVEWVQQRIPET